MQLLSEAAFSCNQHVHMNVLWKMDLMGFRWRERWLKERFQKNQQQGSFRRKGHFGWPESLEKAMLSSKLRGTRCGPKEILQKQQGGSRSVRTRPAEPGPEASASRQCCSTSSNSFQSLHFCQFQKGVRFSTSRPSQKRSTVGNAIENYQHTFCHKPDAGLQHRRSNENVRK
jgi:hypothetical protein